jgi:hypothetical protein
MNANKMPEGLKKWGCNIDLLTFSIMPIQENKKTIKTYC